MRLFVTFLKKVIFSLSDFISKECDFYGDILKMMFGTPISSTFYSGIDN